MMSSDTDDSAIVLGDFGLSKFASDAERFTMAQGTLAYVSPEVTSLSPPTLLTLPASTPSRITLSLPVAHPTPFLPLPLRVVRLCGRC